MRPALHLNLNVSSDATADISWSYAGTVTVEGGDIIPTKKPGRPKRELNNPRIDTNGVVTWDSVYFGSYWQNDTNDDGTVDRNDYKESIRWRVLSVDGDDAFLLADQSLDCRKYNDTITEFTWRTCTLRSWLNGYGAETNVAGNDYSDNNFLNDAFSEEEQSVIKTVNVVNKDNPEFGTEGGNDTSDRVYLLSLDEMNNPSYGFSSDWDKYDEARRVKNTEYAKAEGALTSEEGEYTGNSWWWLRSPGFDNEGAAIVFYSGDVARNGATVRGDNNIGVRPVLHLNLKASSDDESDLEWSYAGTVTSIGELNNPRTGTDGVTTWDCIYYGSYWQNDTNGDGVVDQTDAKEPIMWRVLSYEGDDEYILISDQALDSQPYNETYSETSWAECTLRKWLNREFLQEAFSDPDQKAIMETTIRSDYDPQYGAEETRVTDRIYLLSVLEALNPKYGFDRLIYKSKSREASNTAYAQARGAYSDMRPESSGNGWWWLRSQGSSVDYASAVDGDGTVDMGGYEVSRMQMAVRPSLRVNLAFADWKNAGQINSDGQWIPFSSAEPIVPTTIEPAVSPTTEPTQNQGGQPGEASGSDDGKQLSGDAGSDSAQFKKGSIVTAGGIRYKIMSTKKNNRTVMLWRLKDKRLKKVTIPDTVKLRSQSFQVIKIADRAFEGCKNLKKVTVGRQVEIIGNKSFSGCRKLKRVIIRSKKLKKIGKSAFFGIGKNVQFNLPKGVSKVYRIMIKKAQQ